MIMQLDFAKAYDKLNWIYIKKVLIAFEFDHNWVRWIMDLVTSSSFSILVNGSPSETFIPSRGLRQGDPHSPFLFILMMEGLGRSIKNAKEVGKVKGLQLSDNGQALTHQQFVDDTMLQGIPTVKEALAYKKILSDFAMASGMEVNLSKSKIFFFNTNIAIQRNISRILGFQRDSLPSNYLGVPLTVKPLHKNIWETIINKLQERTRKWTMRSLNLAGRLVLTKAVLQAIPVFMLSAIPAPKGILLQMRNIQRDFLWVKGEEKKKWALVAWEKICKPKNHEGLGLDDLEILSKVLGAKLWWRWIKEPGAHWAIIWKEKYASSWLDNDCIRMDDREALFWEDRWQQEPILLREDLEDLKAETDTKELTKVKDFWDQNNSLGKWRNWRDFDLRNDSHLKDKAKRLMKMLEQRKILVSRGHDQLRWGHYNEGTYNLKEAKLILLELDSHDPDRIWQNLWKHQGWMKIKLFMWLVLPRKSMTWDNIRKRGILGPSRCQLCEAQEETMEHLLNNCIFTSRLWDTFASIFQRSNRNIGSLFNTLTNWRKNFSNNEVLSSSWALTPSFIIWNVWKERNNRIFRNVKESPQYLYDLILKQIKETVGTIVRNLPMNPPFATKWRILYKLEL
eukprot:PITA_20137